MTVRFQTFEQFHGKSNVGSTRLRVHNLIKYWDEAALYRYGENPDVLVFQKVYIQSDYEFPRNFPGLKILDICDPDWLDFQPVKITLEYMDAATCPTEELAKFLRQLTDKPVRVIKDRHDLEPVPPVKKHSGDITQAVWFGYKQNADCLRYVVPSLEKRDIALTVISNDDPFVGRWAEDDRYKSKYKFIKYEEDTFYDDMRPHDVCVLPVSTPPRPVDRFKSNNKTTKAWLAGLPVVKDSDDLHRLNDPKVRQTEAEKFYNKAKEEYNVNISVSEMKELIKDLMQRRKQ